MNEDKDEDKNENETETEQLMYFIASSKWCSLVKDPLKS